MSIRCGLCQYDFEEDAQYVFCECGRLTCEKCVTSVIDASIAEMRGISQTICNCGSQMNEVDVRNIIGEQKWDYWHKIVMRNHLADICKEDQFVNCANCDGGAFIPKGIRLSVIQCFDCNQMTCIKCGTNAHDNQEECPSREYIPDLIQCPCGVNLMTNGEGCNKLECPQCGKKYCRLCQKILCPNRPYSHFGGLNGCPMSGGHPKLPKKPKEPREHGEDTVPPKWLKLFTRT